MCSVDPDLKASLEKTKVMVNGSSTKVALAKSKTDPCGICSLMVMAESALSVPCGKFIHSECAGLKRRTPWYTRHLAGRKCEGDNGEAVDQKKGYVMKCKQ